MLNGSIAHVGQKSGSKSAPPVSSYTKAIREPPVETARELANKGVSRNLCLVREKGSLICFCKMNAIQQHFL
jgi:hypothetical protein